MLAEEIVRKSPEDTLRDVRPYFADVGITRICDITGMDRIGIPVFAAVRPDSKSLAVDSGKGITKEQAKCSAVMEAIERWAQDEQGPGGVRAITLSQKAYRFPMVRGAAFDVDHYHRWFEAEYWNKRFISEKVMVPFYCVKNYEKRLPLYEMCWQSGTNGLAAGNTRTEAILHGVYELIERDAVTIWMAKGAGRKVDDATITGDAAQAMLEMCVDAGVNACICEATSDIGIPVYICILIDSKAEIGAYKGYGCNLDSDLAMQRAICEAAQSRAVFLSGARDDMRWARHLYESQAMSNKQRLFDIAGEEEHPYQKHVPSDPMTDTEAVSYVDDLLVANGCGRIIVADIMQREHACVVKVLSEGLEGYYNAYLKMGGRT